MKYALMIVVVVSAIVFATGIVRQDKWETVCGLLLGIIAILGFALLWRERYLP